MFVRRTMDSSLVILTRTLQGWFSSSWTTLGQSLKKLAWSHCIL